MVLSPLARQVAALGLALSAVALSLAYPLRTYVAQQAAEAQAVVEQQELQERIDDLTAQVDALQDPAYVRIEAKRRLQYVQPSDTVYVVKLPESALTADDIVDELPATDTSSGVDDPATAPDANAGSEEDADTGVPAAIEEDPAPWYQQLWRTLSAGEGS